MKVGLYIVNQLHEITQAGYNVEFSGDFQGMITITYSGEGLDWRHHEHIGYPDQPREELEKGIINSLNSFREKYLNKV